MNTLLDQWILRTDETLRTLAGIHRADRLNPAHGTPSPALTEPERQHAASLMRVNHVGEICAQALYRAQADGTRDPELASHFLHAAKEETDHLAWTAARIRELGSHRSHLNPLWFAGAYMIGRLAAAAGDRWSLGFVVETERQVEAHLDSHLAQLPAGDLRSRAIVDTMKQDEVAHALAAQDLGAAELPAPVKWGMKAAAKVMTTVAHRI
ncbi:MAG: 2-polyprenyl-3-methyl-6-methoxy-1,4-benzoquinone monooxygenase [Burkholderiaceae bacterium]|nr:MAG: 2-polyprenyl-3-methyl-6-methoxy-1,4-benzoquinone monooxygenase [Burkholderiaceae bacterium]